MSDIQRQKEIQDNITTKTVLGTRSLTFSNVHEMDELADAWAKKKSAEGSMAGETFSLDGFLKGKIM